MKQKTKRWKQRNASCSSVTESMKFLSGQTEEELLNPKKDPFLPGLSEVTQTLFGFVKKFKTAPVTLIGDYDMDGIASCYIMSVVIHFLTGTYPEVIIPDRIRDGYGFNDRFIPLLKTDDDGHGLVITVDTGITAIGQVKEAKERGLTVLVIDHHLPKETGELPEADALMDPHCFPEQAEFAHYCAAGLCYRVAKEVFGKEMPELLAAAAVATVTDVVPMLGDNRNIVKQGTKALDEGANKALFILSKHKDINADIIDEDVLGYTIGPIFNAVGRMPDGNPADAVKALIGNMDDIEIARLVFGFKALNDQRKDLERDLMAQLPAGDDYPVVVVVDQEYQGIAGILAGRYAEKANVPSFVLAKSPDGILKGSARAGSSGIHLKEMLDQLSGLLDTYGGHEKAAGLSLREENLEQFREQARAYIDRTGLSGSEENTVYDLRITADQIPSALREVQKFAPFGEGVPKPVFLVEDFALIPDKQGNLFRESAKNAEWIALHGVYADADAFGNDIKADWLSEGMPARMDILGTLYSSWFRGNEKFKLRMIDFDHPGRTRNKDLEGKEKTMEEKKIKYKGFGDIPTGGKEHIICALLGVQEETAKNGSTYCRLKLSDCTGTVQEANMWETTKTILEEGGITPGNLYNAALVCREYQGARSFTIQGSDRAHDILTAPEDADLKDFIKSAPYAGQILYDRILKMVDTACSEPLKTLVHALYEEGREKLLYWAAAVNQHHNYIAGLLWHTMAMVESGLMQTRTTSMKDMNAGLVVAGCALHDIGKLQELETDPLGAATYTEDGHLFGHLCLGMMMVRDKAIELQLMDEEEVKYLLHILASHHTNMEWGAIKEPAFREAALVGYIDQMNATDEKFVEEYAKLEPGSMTDGRSRTLGRTVVKPAFSK